MREPPRQLVEREMLARTQRRHISVGVGVGVGVGLARDQIFRVLDCHGRRRGATAQSRQFVELRQVAANAEAAVAAKHPLTVEYRQAGQFHRETFGTIIDRPGDGEAAPGVVGRQRPRNALVGIEVQFHCEVGPDQPQRGVSARPHQGDEFFGVDREAFVLVDLPHEAQRMPARIGRRVRSPDGCGRLKCGCGRFDLRDGLLDI